MERFARKYFIPDFYELCPVEPELFHAGGLTNGHEDANSHFT